MARYAVLASIALFPASAGAMSAAPEGATARTWNSPHLSGESVTLPLVLVKGYPFLEATINGQKGKLLFDTGDASSFTVNSHAISAPNGVAVGKGAFGSGQTFQKMRFPLIDTLSLPEGLHFTGMTDIGGNPGLPLEQHITPDFIGWLGLGFFDGYVAKLDYARSVVTFHHDDPPGKGARAATAGETVIKTIALGNPDHRNLSTYPIRIGAMEFVGLFDTGSHNTAWMSEEQVAALERAGHLHDDGKGGFTVSGITIDGLALPPLPLDVSHDEPPFAKLLPPSGLPRLVLGYEFLRLYKEVIDYDRGRLMLLKPKP